MNPNFNGSWNLNPMPSYPLSLVDTCANSASEISISISTRKKELVPFFLCLCLCLFHLCYAYRTSVNQALDEQPNSVRRWGDPPYDNQSGYPCCRGRLWEWSNFFEHASCHPTTVLTQFEDLNHVTADATDETKLVTDDKICPWILPWTIVILSSSADQP